MLDSIKEFFRSIALIDEDERGAGPADSVQVATAALLFHIIEADGVVTDGERQRMIAILGEEFSLSVEEATRLASDGRRADQQSVDLYHFTSILKRELSEEQRIRFIELLWEVTYADGEVHELEDNLIWRISELLGVSTRDRMLMKHEAAGRQGE
ncbi:TerB family tellurite resistance protein [Jiella sp. MQZ9-1]|uniref:TerB family tellurite resistance protein n=1 Tax=Jiella flava TaxID=2816857 RepID=A0A939JWL8_9HYPH|nr:TerB family tellurite resistance protein [Jiella flava]MBO0663649.1 TerB family tellurite resistance protein [Jiella flava]MCD2472224.1 TerB family tellurite resistance protein [Jiella flava]